MSIKDKAAVQAGMLFRDSLKHEPVTFGGGRSPTRGSDKTAAGAEALGCGRAGGLRRRTRVSEQMKGNRDPATLSEKAV